MKHILILACGLALLSASPPGHTAKHEQAQYQTPATPVTFAATQFEAVTIRQYRVTPYMAEASYYYPTPVATSSYVARAKKEKFRLPAYCRPSKNLPFDHGLRNS